MTANFAASMQAQLRRLEETGDHALALARAIRAARPKPRPLVEYRCNSTAGACLMLLAYGSPEGPFLYQPRYKYSPNRARQQQTPDGRREFPERAYLLEQLLPPIDALRVQVICRHHVLLLDVAAVAVDVASSATVKRFLPDDVVTVQDTPGA